jgi:hypothetical protein
MIHAVAFTDEWKTLQVVVDEAGKEQSVAYNGPAVTRYQDERSGGAGVQCDYKLTREISQARLFDGWQLPPNPNLTVSYAWFDDKHMAGYEWLLGDQEDFVVLGEEAVADVGQIPEGWPV